MKLDNRKDGWPLHYRNSESVDKKTILLVDDELPILDILSDMLGQYGYKTLTARSGEEALEIYRRDASGVDLVILDIRMPGIGGYRCFEEILRLDPEAKVIISTGYSEDALVKKMLESGAGGFVGKPYKLVDMLNKVREVIVGR